MWHVGHDKPSSAFSTCDLRPTSYCFRLENGKHRALGVGQEIPPEELPTEEPENIE